MKVLSVSEFIEWQREHSPQEFIFDSDNNSWLSPYGIHVVLRFQSVAFSSTMRRVLFRNTRDSLCIEQIKEVHMFDEIDCVGTVFDLICESRERDGPRDVSFCHPGRRRYRFLAD